MYYMIDILFPIVFIIIFAMVILTFVRGLATWNKNNHSPRLSVPARVVAKRQSTSVHDHANVGDATGAHGFHTTSSTSYYVTFQFESGDRMEMSVMGTEYGMLAEGDKGTLTFQGTRYLSFERSY